MNEWITIISSLGFPIAACCAVGYALYKFYKTESEKAKAREDRYLDEIAKFSRSLDNVTDVLIKVNERLDIIERKLE